ncbi:MULTISPECIES: SH3 domain-containing protein [Gulbenkiania]|uniref:SH3-like domain n=2 Tax=Gulbenkiania TaxID=397456 RepID=A0A0K6H2M1_9NEIS|nr:MULTISPECIES: SH3 domain-containing protein [Gulbenkiania]TCW33548.1 SH3-like domain-containing protein [Gulbenkiania mobilis]CUA85237.1 SH3-like domain [Gulbenkiania indica]
MKRCLLMLALAAGIAAPAGALEFRSVKETGVALYEAPSLTARKLFVVSRYYPVEVLSTQKEWARVRDASGGIAWIPGAALSTQRMLLVTAERAEVRDSAAAGAPLRFVLTRDAVVEMQEEPRAGWVRVRHRDGSSGFARIVDLWGL